MIICVNGRFLTRKPTGVDRFAREILSAIDEWLVSRSPLVEGITFRLLVPPGHIESAPFKSLRPEVVGGRSGHLWEQFDLPSALQREDILLSLCNTGPVRRSRQIVVIHDATTAAVPQAFSLGFRLWYRTLMPLLGKRAKAVLTVSEFSRKEIARLFNIPTGKTSVVTEGGEHILRVSPVPEALTRFGLAQRPYVLAVSSMAAHKNFQLVLEAIERVPEATLDIAIAGGANSRVFGKAGALSDPRIRWLGYVSDAELRTLYEGALGFVFPSLYEGFGIPPLEAMHCGCPVLSSNAASMPEVCADAALYFDPRSPEELAAALTRLADDAALRADLKDKGMARAKSFSWQAGAIRVLQTCRDVDTMP